MELGETTINPMIQEGINLALPMLFSRFWHAVGIVKQAV